MARQRRGGGFKPPELRGTLGTLLRTAAAQVGPLRDVLERTVSEGRSRIEDARSSRRRTDALAELGEIVLDLIRRGEIDVAELPEARDIVAHLDDLDAGGHADEDDRDYAPPPVRNRFDSRRRTAVRDRSDENDGTVTSRGWAPPPPRADDGDEDDAGDDAGASRSSSGSSSGTRSTKRGVQPNRAAPAGPPRSASSGPTRTAPAGSSRAGSGGGPKQTTRVWRPPVDDDDLAFRKTDEATPAERPTVRGTRKDPLRKGGISFDDDDDLADYMHPDDVPPRKPPDSDS